MDPNTTLDLFKDKKDVMKEPSSSGGRKSRHVISSSVGHSPYQKRPSKAEQSPSKDTTRDNSCLALDPNINPDLSEDNKDVMTFEQLIQTHSLNRRFPSQDTSVDDSHLTQDANTGQDKDKTEASSHFTLELLKEPGAISYRFMFNFNISLKLTSPGNPALSQSTNLVPSHS
ncbi:uncharacterized protein [Thunnus thynnus]|uniref:uncharacterized protein isoform X1 n=1 Tax=Thunnus thynnus TaxID=8237 RepID=UPI003526F4F7